MTAPPPDLTSPPVDRGNRQDGPISTIAGPAPRLTARSLARLHDRYLSALLRGGDVGQVADWLAAHWQESASPMPDGQPDAVSLGVGIRWYCQGSVVAGYSPCLETGCYRIPVWSTPPALPTPVR